jgi:hypothetical protein
MDEKFWTEDPSVLYKNYYIIIPTGSMTRVEQLNTSTRFLIYFILLCLLFDVGKTIIIYCLVGIILIIIFFNIYVSDPIGIQNDLVAEAEGAEKFISEKSDESCNNCFGLSENFELNEPMVTLYDSVKNKLFKGNDISNVDFQVDSGYIDSDGNYKLGPNYSDINYSDYKKKEKLNNEKKVSWEKNEVFVDNNCRKPTIDNPFTNIVFSDYLDSGNLAVPCNTDDPQINNQMQNLYNSSIYRNLSDVWERENSQRMFYTLPIQTVPNNQTDFANWLYKTGPTCHENSEYCTYYQDPSMTSQRY